MVAGAGALVALDRLVRAAVGVGRCAREEREGDGVRPPGTIASLSVVLSLLESEFGGLGRLGW